jgi:rare lipoprotein A
MLALRPPLLKPDRAHSFLCAAGLGQRDKIVSVSICATRWLSQRSTSFASRVRSKVSTAASSGVKLCRLLRKASPANKRHERTSASWEHWFGPSVADSETDLGHSLATDTGLRRISASSFVSQKLDVAIAAEGCSCDSLLPTLCCQYSADPILVSGNCACAGGKCLRRSRRSLRKSTANGERLNCSAMTAAHRKLPFGTRVRVCHSGCVVVRINDRGPFVRGRDIDLSPAAARAIGLDSTGHVTISEL